MQVYYNILDEFDLLNINTTTKENLLKASAKLNQIYERNRPKKPKLRYVDFNQGTDCGYITEEKMKLISEIPIYPLRIAYDHIELKEQYIHATELAAKYGIKRLSNYLLYNYKDSPEDLYERLQINKFVVSMSSLLWAAAYWLQLYMPDYIQETNESIVNYFNNLALLRNCSF